MFLLLSLLLNSSTIIQSPFVAPSWPFLPFFLISNVTTSQIIRCCHCNVRSFHLRVPSNHLLLHTNSTNYQKLIMDKGDSSAWRGGRMAGTTRSNDVCQGQTGQILHLAECTQPSVLPSELCYKVNKVSASIKLKHKQISTCLVVFPTKAARAWCLRNLIMLPDTGPAHRRSSLAGPMRRASASSA